MVASSIAFSSFLSLLPLLALVILAYGAFADPQDIVANLRELIRIIPYEARSTIDIWLSEALLEPRGRETGFILSLAFLGYSASRAGRSLLYGLNVACDVDHRRGFIARRITSILMVLSGAVLVTIALAAISIFAFVANFLPEGPFSSGISQALLWIGTAAAVAVILTVIYRFGPARPVPPWRRCVPGAILATAAWLAATLLFSLYLSQLDSLGRVYGSLGAIVLLQFWLLASSLIFLLGARFNVEYLGTDA